jgi:hypothetical protein
MLKDEKLMDVFITDTSFPSTDILMGEKNSRRNLERIDSIFPIAKHFTFFGMSQYLKNIADIFWCHLPITFFWVVLWKT